MWADDPDSIQPEPVVPVGAQKRFRMAYNVVYRELIGGGSLPKDSEDTFWTFDHLPLGGRLKVTGVKEGSSLLSVLWLHVKQRRRKKMWGGFVTPNWARGTGVTVHIPFEEFAVIIGKLDQLMREREIWDAAYRDLHRDGRRGP